MTFRKPKKRILDALTRKGNKGNRCVKCGSTEELTIDHIIPLSKGGGDEPQNWQTLCKPCNVRKGNRMEPRKVKLIRYIIDVRKEKGLKE